MRIGQKGYHPIAALTGIARNSLKKYINKFIESGLTFSDLSNLSDKELDYLFVKPADVELSPKLKTLFEFFPKMDKELKRKGVTRQLVWEDYIGNNPEGFKLSQFKHYYTLWKAQVNPTMRMEHKAGDKMYVDFAGDKLSIVDNVWLW